MSNIQKINDKIIDLFDSNNPFSLVRIGHMEGVFIDNMLKGRIPTITDDHPLSFSSGVYPVDPEYLYNIWLKENVNAMNNCDLLGFVDWWCEIVNDPSAIIPLFPDKEIFFKTDVLVLDPGTILDPKLIKNPWTKKLKNKKVLVISSHVDTIKAQWKQIDKIWGNYKNDVVPFHLVDVIRSPFHPKMDSRQYDNCDTWDQTLSAMKAEIDKYDYDVLLVGAASFAPGLADYAKQQGKIGITICGAIQIFFGILGTRWLTEELYVDWKQFFNDNWIFPLETDIPNQQIEKFNQFEKAYW